MRLAQQRSFSSESPTCYTPCSPATVLGYRSTGLKLVELLILGVAVLLQFLRLFLWFSMPSSIRRRLRARAIRMRMEETSTAHPPELLFYD